MIIKEVIKEDIHWDYADEGDLFKSLRSLVLGNNGVWKSINQKNYLFGRIKKLVGNTINKDSALSNYGVHFDPAAGEICLIIRGRVQWSEYGGRSIKPVGYGFILDEIGVKSQYKLKWKESTTVDRNNRRHTSNIIDPANTKTEWVRPDNVDTTYLTAQPQDSKEELAPQGKHVGTVGERVRNLEITIEKIFGPYSSDFGEYYVNRLKDTDGNNLVYFGKNLGSPGSKLNATFTVGKHDIDKNTKEPVTTIKRPIFK